jgi:hypothetical protein
VYLRALVAAALFLARMLDSSQFAVLEAFQDTEYVLTTRGTATPGCVPNYLITQLSKVLQQGSQLLLNESDDEHAPTWLRSTAPTQGVSRELFSYRYLIVTYHYSSVLIARKGGSALFYNIP